MAERKRLDSSMTYDEYVKTYDRAPKKPCLKPKQTPIDLQIEDFDLDSNTQNVNEKKQVKIAENYNVQHVIHEEDDDGNSSVFWIDQPLPEIMENRKRTQSENIEYTFISFIERGLVKRHTRHY